jgi:hypothetical protein
MMGPVLAAKLEVVHRMKVPGIMMMALWLLLKGVSGSLGLGDDADSDYVRPGENSSGVTVVNGTPASLADRHDPTIHSAGRVLPAIKLRRRTLARGCPVVWARVGAGARQSGPRSKQPHADRLRGCSAVRSWRLLLSGGRMTALCTAHAEGNTPMLLMADRTKTKKIRVRPSPASR